MDALKKVIVAALISLGIFLGTQVWYDRNKIQNHTSEEKPMASASIVERSVFKKPLDRQIWLNTQSGENLFSGEVIKTGHESSVSIYFIRSDRIVQLEPDSMIVLQEETGSIKLDLVSGAMDIKPNKNATVFGDQKIQLKSEKNQIDLSRSTASLKRQSNQEISLQVHEGSAELVGDSKEKITLTSGEEATFGNQKATRVENPVELIAPGFASTMIKKSGQAAAVLFQWKIKSKEFANAQSQLFVGEKKSEMKMLEQGDFLRTKTQLPDGEYYWQVKFSKNEKILAESSVSQFKLISLPAPILSQPSHQQVFPLREKQNIKFQWILPAETSRGKFELFSDPSGRQTLVDKDLQRETSLDQNLTPGKYYWRVSVEYPEFKKTMTSSLLSFEVGPPPPPKASPIDVVWNSFPLTYEVLRQVSVPVSWKVSQKNNLAWSLQVQLKEESPSLRTPAAGTAAPILFSPQGQNYVLQFKNPGHYEIQVLGSDLQRVVASTVPLILEIQGKPLLNNPKLLPETGSLEGQESGEVLLKWESISGAEKYKVVIETPDHQKKEITTKEHQTKVKGLPPGTYLVKVFSIDGLERSSGQVRPRNFEIPDPNGLQAPTLKKIKVRK